MSYNKSASESVINWQDADISNRAGVEATGTVTNLVTSYLQMTINSANTICADIGTFRCVYYTRKPQSSHFREKFWFSRKLLICTQKVLIFTEKVIIFTKKLLIFADFILISTECSKIQEFSRKCLHFKSLVLYMPWTPHACLNCIKCI